MAPPLTDGGSLTRAELISAMTDLLVRKEPPSTAEALQLLRLAYPQYPLALRLAALAVAARAGAPKD